MYSAFIFVTDKAPLETVKTYQAHICDPIQNWQRTMGQGQRVIEAFSSSATGVYPWVPTIKRDIIHCRLSRMISITSKGMQISFAIPFLDTKRPLFYAAL